MSDAEESIRNLAGSRWEWVAAAVSFVIVAAAIGFLIYDATDAPEAPLSIEITIDSVVVAGSGYLVEFRADNPSASTASAVPIEGTLRSDGVAGPEQSRVTLDYIPARSSRAGGLFFTRDPREGQLEIRAMGYAEP